MLGPRRVSSAQRLMLQTIIVILVILWLLGYFVMSLGSVIHVLLVLAVILLVVRLLQGRRIV
jgi:hypothetical protein